MKKICFLVAILCCLLSCAAAEGMAGIWSHINGAMPHGDGFVLYEDGTGEWLEALNNNYSPASQLLRTGDTFTWKVEQEGNEKYLVETASDSSVRRFALRIGVPEIYLTLDAKEGEYYHLNAERTVLVDDRLDIITELKAKKGKFSKNKRYNVYLGPGEEYGRSGGGKGVVSTNGDIACYGTWNGYLLVEYEINADKHRYGWISLDELPDNQADDYDYLDFSWSDIGYPCGVLKQDTALTDDPFYSGNAVRQLPAGSSVFVLMRDQDYLLVEGFAGKQKYMGFVHADVVDMKYGYAENAKHTIDVAQTYSEADIHAAMETVEEAVRSWFSGTSVVEIKYIEAESADADDWWQPEEENREGIQLFADLNSMSFYEAEIAAYGVAKDYGFILYRDKGGEWEVCNWGYE